MRRELSDRVPNPSLPGLVPTRVFAPSADDQRKRAPLLPFHNPSRAAPRIRKSRYFDRE